jgi:hypothetical protein
VILQTVTVAGVDVHAEAMLIAWAVFCVAIHAYFRPYQERVVAFHNITLEVLNAILLLVPGFNRYVVTFSTGVLNAVAIIACILPLLLLISLIYFTVYGPPSEVDWTFVLRDEEDALLRELDNFVNVRKPTDYEKLILAGVCSRYLARQRAGLAIEWLRSPLWAEVPVETIVEVMSRMLLHRDEVGNTMDGHPDEVMKLNDELHFLDPDRVSRTLMPDHFPTLHDQLRVLRLWHTDKWRASPDGPVYKPIDLLKKYLAADDGGAAVCHSLLGSAGVYFVSAPRAFLKLLLFHRPYDLERCISAIQKWEQPIGWRQVDIAQQAEDETCAERLAWLDPEYPGEDVIDFFKMSRDDCVRLHRATSKAWSHETDKTARGRSFANICKTEHREVVFEALLELAEHLDVQDPDRLVRLARLNDKPLHWILSRPEFRGTALQRWWLKCAIGKNAGPSIDGFMEKFPELKDETARIAAELAMSRKDQEYAMHIVAVMASDNPEVHSLLKARQTVRRHFTPAKIGKQCMMLTKFERATTLLDSSRTSDCVIALGLESFAIPFAWFLAVRTHIVRDLSEMVCWE